MAIFSNIPYDTNLKHQINHVQNSSGAYYTNFDEYIDLDEFLDDIIEKRQYDRKETVYGNIDSQNESILNYKNIRLRIVGWIYKDSDWSDPLVATVGNWLNTPQNVRVVLNTLMWEAVPHATSYEVKVKDTIYKTFDTTFSLAGISQGSYSMSVRAIGDDKYGNSSWSSPIVNA